MTVAEDDDDGGADDGHDKDNGEEKGGGDDGDGEDGEDVVLVESGRPFVSLGSHSPAKFTSHAQDKLHQGVSFAGSVVSFLFATFLSTDLLFKTERKQNRSQISPPSRFLSQQSFPQKE